MHIDAKVLADIYELLLQFPRYCNKSVYVYCVFFSFLVCTLYIVVNSYTVFRCTEFLYLLYLYLVYMYFLRGWKLIGNCALYTKQE